MAIEQAIRQRGFRKWYERELLVGHSHLVLLLCVLTIMGGMEAFSHPGATRWLITACVLMAAAIGLWALRRYLFLLARAEHIANQAVCAQCKAYGRWAVEEPAAAPARSSEAADDEPVRLQVCCRGCGWRWHIDG